MKFYLRYSALFSLIGFALNIGAAQISENVILRSKFNNKLLVGLENQVSIVARQEAVVSEDQVTAFLLDSDHFVNGTKPIPLEVKKKYGQFIVRPSKGGVVEFHIKMKDKVEIATMVTTSFKAVCRLGRESVNFDTKIPKLRFKKFPGIIAWVENYDIDARCKTIDFEIMRIALGGQRSSSINKGGKFEPVSQALINQAESGDIYIFRRIFYQCPSSDIQQSGDLLFEIE